ncbi:glycoside hydrolase family 3 N-terminal domain-containing protein [Ruania halotolerans]|uniref:glycoside hydrolase family 3 N-terminal domain-containing protein n=1 Tax=Ruania halotolerans TaxID=2897773 RepID=UPI001E47228E|nr:glycoside hydrolase family 3 N-terminal domain-containing protein [Ruania halotolerans]UFU05314.1 beta-glucosidase [Ruania halotolerans]
MQPHSSHAIEAAMTGALRRAIHAVLLPGFSGVSVPEWVADANDLAGVLLFAQNTPDLATTARLNADLRRAHPDLLITIDEEGGNVTRLQADTGSLLPAPAALGAVDDVQLTESCAHAMGALLAACGFDLTFAPVLDVAARPDNPVIGARAFGAAPELVARHGRAVVRGLRGAGVLSGGKHFPGHGDTNVDSHLAMPELDVDEHILEARDLAPFRAAIEEGMDALMVGHLMVPALDTGAPASLSTTILARARGLGFTGPLVTDALDMKAVSADGVGAACVRALAAGADLLCLGSTAEVADDGAHFGEVVATIEAAVRGGHLDESRLHEAAARIATLRRARRSAVTATDVESARDAVERVGTEAARRAIRTRGDVHLRPGDVVTDLIVRWDQAAGATSGPMTGELIEACGLVPVDLQGPGGSTIPPGRRLAVVSREPDGRLADVLAAHPDALLVHVGVAEAAPDHPHIVFTDGIGLASARAAAQACSSPTGRRRS